MRGGTRKGAGRKPAAPGKKRVVITASVAPETRDKLRQWTKETGERLGVVIDYIVSDAE